MDLALLPFALAQTESGEITGPQPVIRVQADANTIVQCVGENGEASPQSAPGGYCEIANWKYATATSSLDRTLASAQVRMYPAPGTAEGNLPADNWSATLTGAEVSGLPAVVSFRYADDVTGLSGAEWSELSSSSWPRATALYKGSFSLVTPSGVELPVNVKARFLADGRIAVADESLLLSPTGVLYLGSSTAQAWLAHKSAAAQMNLSINAPAPKVSVRNGSASIEGNGALVFTSLDDKLGDPDAADWLQADNWRKKGTINFAYTFGLESVVNEGCGASQCPMGFSCQALTGFCERDFAKAPVEVRATFVDDWRRKVPVLQPREGEVHNEASKAVWCADGYTRASHYNLFGRWEDQSPFQTAGDLVCFDDSRTYVTSVGPFPLSSRFELESSKKRTRKTPSQLLTACLTELGRRPGIAITNKAAQSTNDMGDVYEALGFAAECIDLGRIGQILAMEDRQIPTKDPEYTYYLPNMRLRLIQGIMETASFIARQYRQESEMVAAVGETTGATPEADNSLPSADALLDQLFPLFSSVLISDEYKWRNGSIHASVTDRVSSYTPLTWARMAVLIARRDSANGADYRFQYMGACSQDTGLGCTSPTLECDRRRGKCTPPSPDTAPAQHKAGLGPIPATMDALSDYFNLLSAHAQKVHLDQWGGDLPSAAENVVLARAGDALRLSMVVEAYADQSSAAGICTTSLDFDCNVPWGTTLANALLPYKASVKSLHQAARRIVQRENPLGISEQDTPIFFGDVAGKSSRYFASSDYLVGSWAEPAIQSATSALESARSAWLGQKDRSINTEQAAAESARRLEGIARDAGDALQRNCGPIKRTGYFSPLATSEVLTAFMENIGDPSLKPETCYYKPDPEQGCPLPTDKSGASPQELSKSLTRGAVASEFCRIDYLRREHPEAVRALLDGSRMVEHGETGHPEPRGASWQCFMSPGQAEWCDLCTNTTCALPCARPCDEVCKKADTGCLKQCEGYRSESTCERLAGDFRSTAKSFCLSFWDMRDDCQLNSSSPRWFELPAELIVAYPVPFKRQDLQDAAERLRRCKSRLVVPPARPMSPPKAPSTRWQNPMVEYVNAVPTIKTDAAQGACQLDGLDFLTDEALATSKERYPAYWIEAYGSCASQGFDEQLPSVKIPMTCYAGQVGQALASLQQSREQMNEAQGELQRLQADMAEQGFLCEKKAELNKKVIGALDKSRLKSSIFGGIGAILPIVSAVTTAYLTGNPTGIVALFKEQPGLLGKSLEGLAGLADAMITASGSDFQKTQIEVANKIDALECGHQRDQIFRLMKVQALRIKTALAVVDGALLAMRNARTENRQIYESAAAAYKAEKARPSADYNHHMWYDEKVSVFRRDLDWARRLTFLAMRAVEYEFQQSLNFRRDILSASNPKQLQDVLQSLKQEQASRAVNRRRPEESSVVLSLRDDVLGVEDRSKAPSGERAWSAALRFQSRLWDDSFSVRDSDGEWMGQGIPFNLLPTGILETRCGERMWRVTATVQGDGLSEDQPGVHLILLKKNTFASQYCTGRGNGDEFQTNSVRPSAQLFKGDQVGTPEETKAFSASLMYPWFNIRRGEFFSEKYVEGASEELAGRGLYGDYVLLFPRQVLSGGFPLSRVEDVLLRVDYLSVDNISTLKAELMPAGARDPQTQR